MSIFQFKLVGQSQLYELCLFTEEDFDFFFLLDGLLVMGLKFVFGSWHVIIPVEMRAFRTKFTENWLLLLK